MPFFHICRLKSRKYNPAKYCLAEIAKLVTLHKEYFKASSLSAMKTASRKFNDPFNVPVIRLETFRYMIKAF